MLRKLSLAVLVALTAFNIMPAQAQDAASETELPAVQEAAPEAGQSGLMSGEKPFTLMVDENVGELIYTFDEETKELESINAKRGVIFASEDMTLNSDEMEYKTINSSLVATGKRVVVRMGEMVITCQVFKYNPETQEGQFEGNPILYQKDKEGKVTTTAGRIISVFNVNGKFQMSVKGGGGIPTYVKSSGVAGQQNGSLEKKTLKPGQKGATMTLNTTASGLAVGGSSSGNGSQNRSGGIIPVPGASNGDSADTVTKTNTKSDSRIDPDNPADVKKLSDDSAR